MTQSAEGARLQRLFERDRTFGRQHKQAKNMLDHLTLMISSRLTLRLPLETGDAAQDHAAVLALFRDVVASETANTFRLFGVPSSDSAASNEGAKPEVAKPERHFTVMRSQWNWDDRHLIEGCPVSLPWSLVAHAEEQAQINHGQTLTRLNERGGLTPQELYYLLQGQRWPFPEGPIPMVTAVAWLKNFITAKATDA